jgi:alanine dehydrogenase
MRVGVVREIKKHEYRVGLTPSSVREVVAHGHEVLVESSAGGGIGCADDAYRDAGAAITPNAEDVFAATEMIVKVKEPQAVERAMLRRGQILFTYLHLAADPLQVQDLLHSGAVCIAYETITDANGRLPLLAPMSRVAGRMSVQAGAAALERYNGGSGILLGGVTGVPPAKVVVLGGGVVGENAIAVAIGMGADVTLLDRDLATLDRLSARFGSALKTVYSTGEAIETHLLTTDLVIGAVLVAGAHAPKLIRADHVRRMKQGSAIVDVAIDQGGCCETSRPTTHDDPTYIVDGVVHYCVANMPGAVPRTSAIALNNATLPYVLALADNGYRKALGDDPHFKAGLNVCKGKLTHPAVAGDLGLPYAEPDLALSS